jgi:hypothetical protein
VSNPVLATDWPFTVADCGTMRFTGEYYLIGNWLGGDMFVSPDLVHWGSRTHVFSMNNQWATGEAGADIEIHACDPSYYNGTFHLYWSVNRGDLGVVHIGHAVATSQPLGPYSEPVTARWFDDKIDAHLFRDDDGAFTFYSVKFTNGNAIWGQPMQDPWTLSGSPVALLSALGGTWEWLDHKVNEGPFVLKYRGKYFMLYNANHTGEGNYAIGCATAASPLGFSNATKYADPVIDGAIGGANPHTSPGQPTAVRGPNGLEWWLVYFVDVPGAGRQQAIDRIHFFDTRLYVDGPTNPWTPGYHPDPNAPTLLDLFNTPDGSALAPYWEPQDGQWAIRSKEAQQLARAGSGRAIAQSAAARYYVAESGVRLIESAGEKAGLTAYWKDADNWMIVALDQLHGAWYYKKREQGVETVVGTPLPAAFNYRAWHTLRVARNGSAFDVSIDDRPAPGAIAPIATGFAEPGLAGLYTEEAQAGFDGFLYTMGWDETGSAIREWGGAQSGAPSPGSWGAQAQGILQSNAQGLGRAFKGDPIAEYEFAAQATQAAAPPSDGQLHLAGIVPVWTDADNYLRADVAPASGVLRVTAKRFGETLPVQTAPLPRRFPLPTSEQQGQTWRYTTETPAANWYASGFDDANWRAGEGGFGVAGTPGAVVRTAWNTSDIWLRRAFSLDAVPTTRPRLWVHHDEDAEVYINGVAAWQATGYTTAYGSGEVSAAALAALSAGANTIAVHCRQTAGGQYIDAGFYLPRVVETPGSWNLRAVKRPDRVLLFVNGQEIMTVMGSWPRSQVGLETENMTCRFNGITFFRVGSQYGLPAPGDGLPAPGDGLSRARKTWPLFR